MFFNSHFDVPMTAVFSACDVTPPIIPNITTPTPMAPEGGGLCYPNGQAVIKSLSYDEVSNDYADSTSF